MSCILRISGATLDVDAMLLDCTLEADRVWRRGALRRVQGETKTAGANFVASEADFDEFDAQAADAIAFLRMHASEVGRCAGFAGVEHALLDFGVSIYEDSPMKSCHMPHDLIALAATCGISLEVTYYKTESESQHDGLD